MADNDIPEFEKRLEEMRTEIDRMLETIRGKVFASPPTPPPPPFSRHHREDQSIENRPQTTKEYDLRNFTGVRAGGAFEQVEIVKGETYSVSITGEEDLFRNLDVSVEGDTLRVSHSPHLGWLARLSRPSAKITMPVLKEVRLSGACRGKISGFSSTEDFRVELSGASMLTGEITTGNANFELSGATHLTLSGACKDLLVRVSGANHADLRGFTANNAAVKASGASNLIVKLDGKLDARLSGVSHLGWVGNPVMGDIRTSGASTLRKE